jgi:hypothetical protein
MRQAVFQISGQLMDRSRGSAETPLEWTRRVIPMPDDTTVEFVQADGRGDDYVALASWDGVGVPPFEDGVWVSVVVHHVKKPVDGEPDMFASVIAFEHFDLVPREQWPMTAVPA